MKRKKVPPKGLTDRQKLRLALAALRFYANPKSHNLTICKRSGEVLGTDYEADAGALAVETLEKIGV